MRAVLKLFARRSPQRDAAAPRRVWRITAEHPRGAWFDADAPSTTPGDDGGRTTLPMDSWTTSSMELRDGVEIVELDEPQGPHAQKPH